MSNIYIGTSGWNYKHWSDGVFYPTQLPATEWLRFMSQHFDTVEINNSFYRLPSAETFRAWRKQGPAGFTFAVKASRYLTHLKRLKDPSAPLELFISRARKLNEKLGPVLFQLPPQFKRSLERLETFLTVLEKQTSKQNFRAVLEVRDASWLENQVFASLERHRVALCFADWRNLTVAAPVTADFVYVRRHAGSESGNYPKADLERDARRVRRWINQGLDAYVYFNNDPAGNAVRNALYLRSRCLGEQPQTCEIVR
jgi:uncharacterized protein YecE (DUF72 family)